MALSDRDIPRSSPPLKFNVRADLFGQLATLEDAGLPFDKALDIVHLPPKEDLRLKATRKWIRRGVGIAEAGRRSGLFTPIEASLVRTATVAGSPARTYRLLADQCARRAARMKAIRSRMTVPAVMIAVWIILGPVPGLVTGSLTLGGYLAKGLLPWVGVVVIAEYLLLDLLRRRRSSGQSTWGARFDGVLRFVPMFGPMEVRRNLRDFFDSLALLLEAGVPILEAFPIARGHGAKPGTQSAACSNQAADRGGGVFTQAIAGLPLFGRTQAYELIRTGEASGALPRMLSRYSEAETAAIDRFDDLVAEWIPRLAYMATALAVGYGIIHSGAFMPSLPQEPRSRA